MKVRIFIIIAFIVSSYQGYSQMRALECDEMYKEAKRYASKGEYEKALNMLNAAKICNPQEPKYDKEVIVIYKEINLKKEKADQAQILAENEKRKAEEARAALSVVNKDLSENTVLLIKTNDSATSLKNFALAIKHSEKSISIPTYDSGRKTIKAFLALISYQLLQKSGKESNKLQTQIYSSLYDAIKSNIGENGAAGFSWNVTSTRRKNRDYQEGADHIAYAALARDGNNRPKIYVSAENSRLYTFDPDANTSDSIAYAALAPYRSKHPKTSLSADTNRQYTFEVDTIISTKKNVKARREIFLGIKASPNGRWTAMNTLSRQLFIVDHTTGLQSFKQIRSIEGILKFWLDDSTLYAYKQDSGLYRILLAEDKVKNNRKFAFRIEDLATSDKHVYALTDKGVVKWAKKNSNSDDEFITLNRPDRTFTGTKIRCTADDRLIVWGNENGQVYFLRTDSDTAQHLASFSGPITDIAINDSGKLVAIANYDKSIRVFNLLNLEEDVPLILNANEGPVTSVFFGRDKDGKEMLVAAVSPGFIRLYPMNLETLACKLYTSYISKPQAPGFSEYVDQAVGNKNVENPCK